METPVQSQRSELSLLNEEKGDLVTKLEIGQGRLQQINSRIAQILNINPVQPNQR